MGHERRNGVENDKFWEEKLCSVAKVSIPQEQVLIFRRQNASESILCQKYQYLEDIMPWEVLCVKSIEI